jgi:hypothetical protein
MATTNFVNGTVVTADWLNDVDAVVYETIPELLAQDASQFYLKDYCVGDGITDDGAGLYTALAAAAGKPIDGGGHTYKITTVQTYTGSVWLSNATLDFSGIAAGSTGLTITGSLGSSFPVTASVSSGATSFTYTGTASLSAGQRVILASSNLWSSSVTLQEWVRLKTIVGNLLTTYAEVRYDYTSSPVVYFPTTVPYVRLNNVKTIGTGAGTDTNCIYLYYVDEVRVNNYIGDFAGYRSLATYHCRDVKLSNSTGSEADQVAGYGYLFAVSGTCDTAQATNISGEGYRHLFTCGGSTGVVQNQLAVNVSGKNMHDATVDAHPAVDNFIVSNISHDSNMSTGQDGVVSQARNTNISSVVFKKTKRHGVLVQPSCVMYPSSIDISNVAGDLFTSSPVAIGLEQAQTSYVSLDGIQAFTGTGISITSSTVGALGATRIVLGNNNRVVSSGRAVNIQFSAAANVTDTVSITGGLYKSTAVINECINVNYTGATAPLTNLIINGVYAQGANNTIRGQNYTKCVAVGNVVRGWVAAAFNGITDAPPNILVPAGSNMTVV